MSFIKDLLKNKREGQTVFSLTELSSINNHYFGSKLNSSIKYAVKNLDLIRISKGLYSLNKEYSKQEFANKYRTPSYISFYTVLQELGVVFQPYTSIFVASQRSEQKIIDGQKYIYRKLRNEILLNPLGIVNINGIFKASLERALCDKIYLDGDEYFDNLGNVDREKIDKINSDVYKNNPIISKWISRNIN